MEKYTKEDLQDVIACLAGALIAISMDGQTNSPIAKMALSINSEVLKDLQKERTNAKD